MLNSLLWLVRVNTMSSNDIADFIGIYSVSKILLETFKRFCHMMIALCNVFLTAGVRVCVCVCVYVCVCVCELSIRACV